MRKIWIMALVALSVACQNTSSDNEAELAEQPVEEVMPETQLAFFGSEITEEGAIMSNELLAQLEGKDSVRLKVHGEINKVCQVKGCWMTMNVGEEQAMRVSFKDYGFFVPKDISGKESVIEGMAFIETTSVEDLKHYAEDEGLSQEEIDAITEPETNLSFVADGVIVRDYAVATETQETSQDHDHDHDHEGEHDH